MVRAIRSRRGRLAAAVAGLLLAAVALHSLLGTGFQFGRAVTVLSHPAMPWIVLALACELVSYLAYALAQRRLVRAAGQRVTAGWLACLSVGAQALSNFLPAGYLASNVLNFNELRHRRLSSAQATWTLVMSSALYIGTLATLSLIAAELAGGQTAGPLRDLGLAALVLVGLLATTLPLLARSRALRRAAGHGPAGLGLLGASRAAQWTGRAQRFLTSLSETRLSRRHLALCVAGFAACWLADAACLIATFPAVGAAIPWSTLPLAYCGAQLVSFLPITPGGVGLVEGSLVVALVSRGGAGIHVLSAILLYRLISYWGTLPAGAVGYAVVRRTRPDSVEEEWVASPEWSPSRISAVPSNT